MYRILIADNSFLMREAIITVIRQVSGFEVLAQSSSGEEAVAFCKANSVDIVFMEVMMPGMTGIEAAREIYEIDRNITVYLMSTYTSFAFAREVLRLNVRDYLSKPVSIRAVKELLENYKIEKEGNNQDLLFLLREITNSCDFRRVYHEIEGCAAKIFKDCDGKKERIQSVLSYIGQDLIGDYCDFENPTVARELLYPISENEKPTRIFVEIWLTRLMIDVFSHNANRKYPVMERIIGYMNLHYREPLGLDDIIKNCNISQGYLSRIFKRQYTVSVMEYLHMRRLIVAKIYLHFSSYTAIDIAYNLGYNESGYFSKVFKKYEGITTQEYRKRCQSSGEVFAGDCEKYLGNIGLGCLA
jgi:two-component system response regulator YesN